MESRDELLPLLVLLLPTDRLRAAGILAPTRRRPGGVDQRARRGFGALIRGSGSAKAAELAAMLALLVGACYLLALVLRLGWLADYFSRPVLIGYIHGVAVVLIIGQLGKLTGISISPSDPIPQLVEAVKEIGNASASTLAVGVVALAVMLPLRWIAPRFPAALVVVAAGIALSAWLNLDQHGVAVVGHIPSGLPSLKFPTPPLRQVFDLVLAALGLFLVSFADAILTARSYAQAARGADRNRAGDAGAGGRERRGRRLTGVSGWCERVAKRRERLDGGAEPGGCVDRGHRGRWDLSIPDCPDRASSKGGARRRDRLGGARCRPSVVVQGAPNLTAMCGRQSPRMARGPLTHARQYIRQTTS